MLVRFTMMVPAMAVRFTVTDGPNSQADVGETVTVVPIDSVTPSATQLYTQAGMDAHTLIPAASTGWAYSNWQSSNTLTRSGMSMGHMSSIPCKASITRLLPRAKGFHSLHFR